jgi:CubicO group peptidase (beta-lactamase class C family)
MSARSRLVGREEIYFGRQATTESFPNGPPTSNAWQWDAIWPDGDMLKGGAFGQGLYVSPAKDLVVAYFSTVRNTALAQYARQIATALGPTAVG